MAGTETSDVIALVKATLDNDATLRAFSLNGWFKDIAQGVAWPFGILQFQGGSDIRYVGAIRVGVDGLLTVKVVGTDGTFTATLQPAAKRVDALLQGLETNNSNVALFGKLVREQPLDMSEVVNGEVIRHLGGIYRFAAQ